MIRTQVSLAPKFMLCLHLSLSTFSIRQHVPGRQVWQELLPLVFVAFTSGPTIPTSSSGPFPLGIWRQWGERFLLLAPASGRSVGIFSSLGRLQLKQAQGLNLPCQPCLPSPPRKVYGRLSAALLRQPVMFITAIKHSKAPALISCPSLSCNRRFFS